MAITVKTITLFPLNGSTREFNINFDYLARRFVQVSLVSDDDRKELVLGTDYRFATATSIRTTVALGAPYDRIEIRRVTSTTDRVVNFADGSILRATDLNASQIQAIHIAEEARDVSVLSISQNDEGNLDAKNRRIIRVSAPLEDTDAATKGYADSEVSKTLRVEQRINKIAGSTVSSLVGFNGNGDPITYPYSGTNMEEWGARLASEEGGSMIGVDGLPAGTRLQDIVDAPSIITGTVNIREARWNAPRDNAEDPAAAAANVVAINKMMASGARHIELDDRARRVNSTLYYRSSLSIHGAGRSSKSLVWTGGDAPVIARTTYADKNTAGASNVRIQDLGITDLAPSRVSYYTVDLFNGNSNGMERCWVDAPGRYNADGSRIVTSDRYGVALGVARNSNLPGSSGFVSHFRDSRITNGTLMINGTDWYVTGSELWGSFRNRAVEISGGGTVDGGTQIVPGAEAGIFLFSDVGYDIDTLKLLGVYFDGSTDKSLFTGWGIKSAAGIGLVSAEILGCDFWHTNQGGIYVSKIQSSTISSNFRDCDSDDTGEDDIRCDDVSGSRIVNVHYRSTAPKTEAPRTTLGRPFNLTGHVGFPLSTVGGEVTYASSYSRCRVVNTDVVRSAGGSFYTTFTYTSLPPASPRVGEIVLIANRAYYSDGNTWRDVSGYTGSLEVATDLRSLADLPSYYTSDITKHVNVPSGVGGTVLTGAALIEVFNVSPAYRTLRVTILKESGGVYFATMTAGAWSGWSKLS